MKEMLLKCRACNEVWQIGCEEEEWDAAAKEIDSKNISQIIAHLGFKKCPCCKSKDVTHEKFILTLTLLDKSPKTVGTLAEQNSKKLGTYGRQEAEKRRTESNKEAKKLASNSTRVVPRKSEFKSYWPKLSKDAIKKMDVKDYITSPGPPKEM